MDPRLLLQQFGIKPKKSLGQNFLVDERAAARIVAAAGLAPEDEVLEVGPGLGALTRHLAEQARRVVAVELDQRLIPALQYTLAGYDNVELVHGDILDIEPARLLHTGYKVVANIPYYITSNLIRHLLESDTRPASLVLTVQQEVAQRIVAVPGDMSLLAVSVQVYGRPRIVARLKAGAFYPRPKVDSAVVHIDLSAEARSSLASHDVDMFFRVAKAGFAQRRKQVRNALGAGLGRRQEEVDAALAEAGIEPSRRAETLSVEEWVNLTHAFSRTNQAGTRTVSLG